MLGTQQCSRKAAGKAQRRTAPPASGAWRQRRRRRRPAWAALAAPPRLSPAPGSSALPLGGRRAVEGPLRGPTPSGSRLAELWAGWTGGSDARDARRMSCGGPRCTHHPAAAAAATMPRLARACAAAWAGGLAGRGSCARPCMSHRSTHGHDSILHVTEIRLRTTGRGAAKQVSSASNAHAPTGRRTAARGL